MRHIKKFSFNEERFINESKSEPMYYGISAEEFNEVRFKNLRTVIGDMVNDIINNGLDPFTINEIEKIGKRLKTTWSKMSILSKSSIDIQSSIGSDIIGYYTNLFRIHKLRDEWFVIKKKNYKNEEYYYKCDQIDGLMEFLEDEGVVNLK